MERRPVAIRADVFGEIMAQRVGEGHVRDRRAFDFFEDERERFGDGDQRHLSDSGSLNLMR